MGEDCPFGLDPPNPQYSSALADKPVRDFETSTYQEMTNPIKMGGLCNQYHDATQDFEHPHAFIDSKMMADIAQSRIVI